MCRRYQPVVKVWIPVRNKLNDPQPLFLQCAHGNGHPQAAGEARGHLDCAQRVGVGAGTSVLSAAKRVAGGRALRRICRRAGREVLCGQVRAAVADAGDLLPLAADRVFRGHRQRAWDCLAVSGLAGAAALCGHRAGRDDAGPLDDFAHAAADRCGDTSRGIWLGAGRAGLRGLLKGQRVAIDATTLEANAAMRSIVRRDTGASYEQFLRGLAKASGIATPTREDLVRLDRKRKKRMSNQEWKSPADGDARIAKMKDGRTHLAHKAEHAVDLDTGAVVAVTLQGADQGDTATLDETLSEAGMAVAEQIGREAELRPGDKPKVNVKGIEELVTDKGYHSGAVVERVKSYEIRSYLPEKQQKGRRNWQGKAEQQQAVYQNRRRVRGSYGKSLLRRRGELVERSFAHCYDTGGMRRTHLRGHENILKRQLVHVGAFNLSLILRQLLGAGTPREWKNRGGVLVLLVYSLLTRWEARNQLYRRRSSTSGVKSFASPRTRVCRWPCRKSPIYTTGC